MPHPLMWSSYDQRRRCKHSMATTKRTRAINLLRALQKELGDVLLSVAIEKLREPPPPKKDPWRPTVYETKQLQDIYANVLALMEMGYRVTAACREYGRIANMGHDAVEAHYRHATRMHEFLWEDAAIAELVAEKKQALLAAGLPPPSPR